MIQRRCVSQGERLGQQSIEMLIPQTIALIFIVPSLSSWGAQIPQSDTPIGNAYGMPSPCELFHRLGIT